MSPTTSIDGLNDKTELTQSKQQTASVTADNDQFSRPFNVQDTTVTAPISIVLIKPSAWSYPTIDEMTSDLPKKAWLSLSQGHWPIDKDPNATAYFVKSRDSGTDLTIISPILTTAHRMQGLGLAHLVACQNDMIGYTKSSDGKSFKESMDPCSVSTCTEQEEEMMKSLVIESIAIHPDAEMSFWVLE